MSALLFFPLSITQTYSLGLVDLKSGKHSGRNSTLTPAWCGARFLVNGGKTKNKHSRVLSTWNGAPNYEEGRYLMIPYGKLGWGVGGCRGVCTALFHLSPEVQHTILSQQQNQPGGQSNATETMTDSKTARVFGCSR